MHTVNISQWHTLRYSHSQGAFHVSTVESAVNDGLNSVRGHRRVESDWVLVGIAEKKEDISALTRKLGRELAGDEPLPGPLPSLE